jgi:hypothetical protein
MSRGDQPTVIPDPAAKGFFDTGGVAFFRVFSFESIKFCLPATQIASRIEVSAVRGGDFNDSAANLKVVSGTPFSGLS